MKNPKNVFTKLFSIDKGDFRPFIVVFLNKLNPKFCSNILEKIKLISERVNGKNEPKSLDKIKKLLEEKTEVKEELVSELEKIEKNFESEKDFKIEENNINNQELENSKMDDEKNNADNSISDIYNKEKNIENLEIIDEKNVLTLNNENDDRISENNTNLIETNDIYSEKWCKIEKYNQFTSKGLILKSANTKSKEELSEKIMLLIEYVVKMNNFPNNINWNDINDIVEQDFLKYKF